MHDDYLWDGRGTDEEVAHLEALLGRFAAPPPARLAALPLPADGPSVAGSMRRSWLAAAAVAVLAIGASMLTHEPAAGAREPWRVARVEGQPTLAAAPLTRHMAVTAGRWLDTDATSSAVVFVGRIGRLEVSPDSRLRLTVAAPGDHRAELERGTIDVLIWAPPGQFVIDTPSATAVDLGCAYTLTVDRNGVGVVTVQGGWVGFEHQGREAFIPAGAVGRTYPERGPGAPVYADASPALRDAVAALDVADGADAQQGPLAVVLRESRPADGLTLWHLIDRVEPSLAPLVVDRLHALVPMPPSVTRAGILSGDRTMRDAWWDALGLRSASWWRVWRQRWNP